MAKIAWNRSLDIPAGIVLSTMKLKDHVYLILIITLYTEFLDHILTNNDQPERGVRRIRNKNGVIKANEHQNRVTSLFLQRSVSKRLHCQ
jgi:hypothetical protein